MTNELYVSVDIECNGPCPGLYSMWSLGAVAFYRGWSDIRQIAVFHANLQNLPEAMEDPDTMRFWSTVDPLVVESIHRDAKDPGEATREFHEWLTHLPSTPVFIGYPACFDYPWVLYYLHRYCQHNPFGISGFDIKTAMSVILKKDFKATTKRSMPQEWRGSHKHTHHPLDDAIEQAQLFNNVLNYMDRMARAIL